MFRARTRLRSEHLSKQGFVTGYDAGSCIVIEDAPPGGRAHAGSQFRVIEKTNEAACYFL
jgi:beta-phosphoglucomutase-like phosphatase (HAD superfamily)